MGQCGWLVMIGLVEFDDLIGLEFASDGIEKTMDITRVGVCRRQ